MLESAVWVPERDRVLEAFCNCGFKQVFQDAPPLDYVWNLWTLEWGAKFWKVSTLKVQYRRDINLEQLGLLFPVQWFVLSFWACWDYAHWHWLCFAPFLPVMWLKSQRLWISCPSRRQKVRELHSSPSLSMGDHCVVNVHLSRLIKQVLLHALCAKQHQRIVSKWAQVMLK